MNPYVMGASMLQGANSAWQYAKNTTYVFDEKCQRTTTKVVFTASFFTMICVIVCLSLVAWMLNRQNNDMWYIPVIFAMALFFSYCVFALILHFKCRKDKSQINQV